MRPLPSHTFSAAVGGQGLPAAIGNQSHQHTPGLVALTSKNSLPPGSLSVHLWPEGQVLWRVHEDTSGTEVKGRGMISCPKGCLAQLSALPGPHN